MATNDGGITGRGLRWERLHSIWILWTFTLGFFNWIGFLYVGIRVRRLAWVAWGAFYSTAFIFAMLTVDANPPLFELIGTPLTLILGIAGIVHAFRIRPEYLKRLAAQQGAGARPSESFYPQEQRRQEQLSSAVATAGPSPTVPSVDHVPTPVPRQAASTTSGSGMALDLNGATERELASLPGVGPVLAKRAATERAQRGGFSSVDELGQVLGLKPHVVERLRPLLTVGPRPQQSGAGRTGRLIDF